MLRLTIMCLKVCGMSIVRFFAFPTCTCGSGTFNIVKDTNVVVQKDYVVNFLVGLNESFNHARSKVLMMTPSPDLSKVYSILLQEESQGL